MRIALTLDRDETPAEASDYVRALVSAGFGREEIVVLAPGQMPSGSFDGVVLGGGVDVDPARYGQTARPGAGVEVDPERDATDLGVFEKAWSEETPILGICRGLQVVNVALGGTLVQDLPSQRPSSLEHQRGPKDRTRRDHAVRIAAGTRLAATARAGEIGVNSRHHQSIDRLATGLTASAEAPDGTVEGVEATGERWCVAVQWHPENLADDPPSRALFEAFARAVRERAGEELFP
jgi:putative glutamine amidotransferase